jgi:hypothetical protein
MRRLTIAMLIVTAAIATPLGAARAAANDHHALAITLVQPVNFAAPTADCPAGVVSYGISVDRKIGTGTNCLLLDPILVDCPPTTTAQFCQDVPVRMSLTLRGSTLEADVTISEAWTCTATCVVDQRWSGTVTRTGRRFHELVGASVSGGGRFTLDAATFAMLAIDEVLVITPANAHNVK